MVDSLLLAVVGRNASTPLGKVHRGLVVELSLSLGTKGGGVIVTPKKTKNMARRILLEDLWCRTIVTVFLWLLFSSTRNDIFLFSRNELRK